MDKYTEAIKRIVAEQQLIVGPVALDLAQRTPGLNITSKDVHITGNPKEVLNNVVQQYENLFGKASIQVSKKALATAKISFTPEELPSSLL